MSTNRTGRQMRAALEYVTENPGTCRYDIAYHIAGSGNIRGGIAAVNRAIRAGLLYTRISPVSGAVPEVYVTGQ